MIVDFSVEHCVVCETFEGGSCRYMGGHVIYIEKEEEGAKNSTLWDSRVPDPTCTLLPALLEFY